MSTRDTPVCSEISIFSLIRRDIIKSIKSHGEKVLARNLNGAGSRIDDASLQIAFFPKFPQRSKQHVQSRTRVISHDVEYDHQSSEPFILTRLDYKL